MRGIPVVDSGLDATRALHPPSDNAYTALIATAVLCYQDPTGADPTETALLQGTVMTVRKF